MGMVVVLEYIPLVSQDEGVDVSLAAEGTLHVVDKDYPDQRRVVVVTMAADCHPLLKTGVRLAMQH